MTEGNILVNGAAKAAALRPLQVQPKTHGEMLLTITEEDLKREHETLPTEEIEKWNHLRAKRVNGIWTLGGKPFLPRVMLIPLVRELHHWTCGGASYLENQVFHSWMAPGLTQAVLQVTKGCLRCVEFNTNSKIEAKPKGGHPWAWMPFQKLQIDFADMPPKDGQKYLLVIMDQLSCWVESFPTQKASVQVMVKALLKDTIPCFGVPEETDSVLDLAEMDLIFPRAILTLLCCVLVASKVVITYQCFGYC